MSERPRIFCVGMNKTGTTSLMHALAALDVGELAPRGQRLVRLAGRILREYDYEPALREPGHHRIYKDRPWNVWDMYRRLDERFPGSLFILSVREPEAWWRSVERWLAVSKPWMAELYRLHLRAPDLSQGALVAGYLRHNREVRAYFAGRPDFLELDVTAGAGWQPLCAFLGCASPNIPFPHSNRQRYGSGDRLARSSHQGPGLRRRLLRTAARVFGRGRSCAVCARELALSTRGSWEPRPLPRLPVDELVIRYERWRARRTRELHPPPRWQLRRAGSKPSLGLVCAVSDLAARPERAERCRRFLAGLRQSGLPSLTVECAQADRPFALGPDDGRLLQVRTPDLLVQRERLWNLGIARLLAEGLEAVAWLEPAFHVPEPQAWLEQAREVLRQAPVCQLFDRAGQPGGELVHGAVAAYQQQAQRLVWGPGEALVPVGLPGLAWAARAEVLRAVPLFDCAVAGDGPALQFHGSYGYSAAWLAEAWALTDAVLPRCGGCARKPAAPEYTWQYVCWAQRWARACAGRVGLVRQQLLLDAPPRTFGPTRRLPLLRHHFAPGRDLQPTPDGTWCWAAAGPELRREIAELVDAGLQA